MKRLHVVALTASVVLNLGVGWAVSLQARDPAMVIAPMASAPILLTLEPPSSPRTPTPDQPAHGEAAQPDAARPRATPTPVTPPMTPRPALSPAADPLPAPRPADPAEPAREEGRSQAAASAAPLRPPAPPSTRAAGAVRQSWEGSVLARLEAYRRYPAAARRRRVEGVAHVRFRMDRQGRVIDVVLTRSSGASELDREALATVRRAAPLPPPPESVPGAVIELVVPVEFFVR